MIKTLPKIYYGYSVDSESIYINFSENGEEITATITSGNYTFTDLADEIATAMSDAGGQTYSVTTNRTDRTYTISAENDFEILFGTGSNMGLSVASVIGFLASDYTGANTYTGSTAGSEYQPCFWPQSYRGLEDWKGYENATVNTSASGRVQTYSPSGLVSYMAFEFRFIRNEAWNDSRFIDDASAIENVRSFLTYAITKSYVEFMEDGDNVDNYRTIMLDKTATSSTGTEFKLIPDSILDSLRTGLLTFRERV